MKFAHLGDCHLGSWRIPALQELNLESFRKAFELCIKEKVDFILIAGDLFDSAYPPIEILKEAFFEFKKLKEAGIKCFIIAGSHDYSASGKTFLDVLEKAGFCTNVCRTEERQDRIILNPSLFEDFAIYGYPGKKSGMEIDELRKIKLQETPGFFKIFMLHTSIRGAIGSLPIDSISENELPEADYYALGHLHVDYAENKFVYSGPIFPNNFQEIEELKYGTFYIVDVISGKMSYKKMQLKLKEVEVLDLEIKNALTATEKIISELEKRNLKDKIVLLKLSGKLDKGKMSNINFKEIENFVKNKGAYTIVKSTSQLSAEEIKLEVEISDMDKIEESIIKNYIHDNPADFTKFVNPLINSMAMEKQDDEKSAVFESRLFEEIKKILNLA
ncbi:DNA repair exonuclease [Candidatus Pacearchaeota archaeon]|nr:DNA repair exonuclease [Candidatus Pacearchaeota archaeon]